MSLSPIFSAQVSHFSAEISKVIFEGEKRRRKKKDRGRGREEEEVSKNGGVGVGCHHRPSNELAARPTSNGEKKISVGERRKRGENAREGNGY